MRGTVVVLAAVAALGLASLGETYLIFGATTGLFRWSNLPIRYLVTNRGAPGVSPEQFAGVVDASFAAWHELLTTSVSFRSLGFTAAEPAVLVPPGRLSTERDDTVTVGYQSLGGSGILGVTIIRDDEVTGKIVDADVIINSFYSWSTSPSGEAGKFDLRSVMTHEFGHVLGLGHSALGETERGPAGGRRVLGTGAIMFPIAFSPGSAVERLGADDVAGASVLYPASTFREKTGTLRGRVTRNGRGLFGAHVVAFDPRTGKLVGSFSLSSEGRFTVSGLEPGPKVVRVEPLDDAAVTSFFGSSDPVDLDFAVTYLDRLAFVPEGGASDPVQVEVKPR